MTYIGCEIIIKWHERKRLPEQSARRPFIVLIHLPRELEDVLLSIPSLTERMMLMSTYEEFMIILTVALVIVSILNMKNKK